MNPSMKYILHVQQLQFFARKFNYFYISNQRVFRNGKWTNIDFSNFNRLCRLPRLPNPLEQRKEFF